MSVNCTINEVLVAENSKVYFTKCVVKETLATYILFKRTATVEELSPSAPALIQNENISLECITCGGIFTVCSMKFCFKPELSLIIATKYFPEGADAPLPQIKQFDRTTAIPPRAVQP